jgi:calcineurin-like phosphoesterase
MTGDYDSVIGVDKDIAMHRFIRKMPGERLRPANGPGMMCGCLIETNDKNGKAIKIAPVRMGAVLSQTMPDF